LISDIVSSNMTKHNTKQMRWINRHFINSINQRVRFDNSGIEDNQYRELKLATKFLLSAIVKVPLSKDNYFEYNKRFKSSILTFHQPEKSGLAYCINFS
jgi:hypothetical protein